MKIRFHKQLYSTGISKLRLFAIKKGILGKIPKLSVFLVTLPLGNQGLLEIYWYPELLQKAYQTLDEELVVVGMASSREDAFDLVEQIVSKVGVVEGQIPVDSFFKEHS